jgi:hypothetical protein
MVQQSVLGLSRYLESSTPLAALMRDAHDFILHDTTSTGIHLPHEYDADVTDFESLYGTIGPQTDPYFSSAASCRSTSVILVTDGEPWEDLDANMSKYADLLHDEGVNTFVIGVGLDSARWNPPGSTTTADTITADCSKLTLADLGTGRMCQRDTIGGRRWKYADVAPWKNSPKITPGGIRACCNLLETAVLGGTSRAYFPKNQLELKQELNKIFGSISGGAVSRTVPVFGGVLEQLSHGPRLPRPCVQEQQGDRHSAHTHRHVWGRRRCTRHVREPRAPGRGNVARSESVQCIAEVKLVGFSFVEYGLVCIHSCI